MPRKKIIGTIDSETDPFQFERIPEPFSWGILLNTGERFLSWGKKCTTEVVDYLLELDECEIYAHNGGKYDFHFLLPYANRHEPVKIINGRIAVMKIGQVKLIDSFLLMPFALAAYQKTEIDYKKFEADVRQKHKQEIQKYQLDDCRDLLELITGFHKIVGKKLTIGSAAFYQMKKLGFEIPRCGESHDLKFRPFYYGGRVQAFRPGVYENVNLQYVDINSAYPRAMMEAHPIGTEYTMTKRLPKRTGAYFVEVDAISHGALPIRDEAGFLTFPDDNNIKRFYVTGWELQAGIDTGTVEVIRVHKVYKPLRYQSYEKYVEKFYSLRQQAKAEGNKIMDLASKILLNSGYGKWATDPRKFKDYIFADYGVWPDGYDLEADLLGVSLWSTPAYDERGFYDVAVAASITGYVRAFLWRSICSCENVYYCDTDSIICESHNLEMGNKLGQWKLEGVIDKAYIGGKKMYAVRVKAEGWKTASKGVKLSPRELKKVAGGHTVKWRNDAPSFSVTRGVSFTQREVKRTA